MGQSLVIKNCLNGSLVSTVFCGYLGYTDDAIRIVGDLRDAVHGYYYDNCYDISLSEVDNFNLACLRGVEGIAFKDEGSIDYVRGLTGGATSGVFGGRISDALIAFTKHGMSSSLSDAYLVITINWVEVDGIISIDASTYDFSLATNYLYTFENLEVDRFDSLFEPEMTGVDLELLDSGLPEEVLSLPLRDKLFYIVDNLSYDCVQGLYFTDIVVSGYPDVWYSEEDSTIMCRVC